MNNQYFGREEDFPYQPPQANIPSKPEGLPEANDSYPGRRYAAQVSPQSDFSCAQYAFSKSDLPAPAQDGYADHSYYQTQGTWTIDPKTHKRVPFLPQIETLPGNEIPGSYNFFRIPRSSTNYRWWRPFIVAIMIFIIFFGFSLVGGILLGLIAPQKTLAIYEQLQSGKLNPTPEVMLLLFGSVALLLPAIFIAQLFGKWEKLGYISSVAGGIRWRWLGLCSLVTLIPFGIITAINFYLLHLSGELNFGPKLTGYTVVLICLLFIVIPFQSAAEEYLYRGFIGQTIGHWTKSPILAVLIPIPLFVFSHNYDSWAMLSVAYIALLAGILTWKTGGLEAGIALHAVNNISSSIVFFFVEVVDLQESGTSFDFFVQSFAVTCATIAIILLAKRNKIENTLMINSEVSRHNNLG